MNSVYYMRAKNKLICESILIETSKNSARTCT